MVNTNMTINEITVYVMFSVTNQTSTAAIDGGIRE